MWREIGKKDRDKDILHEQISAAARTRESMPYGENDGKKQVTEKKCEAWEMSTKMSLLNLAFITR